MKKVLVCGYFGFGNAGDELILDSIVSGLSAETAGAEFSVMYRKPFRPFCRVPVKVVDRWNPLSVLSAIQETDLLVCGGGLFQDITSSLSLWYYCAVILAAKAFRKKTLLFGVDFAPVSKNKNKRLLNKVLRLVDKICVRSEGSLKFLEEIGVRGNVLLTADAVLNYPYSGAKRRAAGLSRVGLILKKKKGPSGSREEPIDSAVEMCNAIRSRLNAEIVFIPFHLDRDFDISVEVAGKLKFSATVARWQNPRDLFEIMKGTDFILSQRYHGLVIGAMLNLPVMGISNDKKLEYFFNELGQKHLLLDSIDQDKIADIMNTVWEWRSDYTSLLEKNLAKMRCRAFLNITQGAQLLNN